MWFDEECKIKRQEILQCMNDGDKCELVKEYRTLKQQKKRQYKKRSM